MSRVVVVREHGGPENLLVEARQLGAPGTGQVHIRHTAIGLNYIDTYHRSGLYKQQLPFIAGVEAAGTVIAVGPTVEGFQVGDRVGYSGPAGAYADERLIDAEKLVLLPDGISEEVAAAVLSKGTTAYYLLFQTWPLKSGETILFHAAAGGVGLLACQWAHALGARVIGTAGSDEKLALALANGCDEVINYRAEPFAPRVRQLTGGRGVDVVYDGVGKETFEASLDCLRPRGLMVSFGNASGPVSVPNLGILASKGSLYVTRPTTSAYFTNPAEYRAAATAVFDAILAGQLNVTIGQRFALSDVVAAHQALESRATIGSTLLIP